QSRHDQVRSASARVEAVRDSQLQMGLLNKLYLRFPKRFWSGKPDWIEHASPKGSDWPLFFKLDTYCDTPLLVGFTVGEVARQKEQRPDGMIVGSAMKVLRSISRGPIPNPVASVFTRWAADPFAKGSYCYVPPYASGDDLELLALPVGDRLYFAGEATSRHQ